MMHKPSNLIKMVGVERADWLNEAVASVCGGMVNQTKDSNAPEWHVRSGIFGYEVMRETLPYVIGIRKSDVCSTVSKVQ